MGKIIVDLDVELAKNKMSLTELSDQVGITIANLSILKTNKAKAIRFSTLSEICRVLNCDVGDILRYQGDEDDRDQSVKKVENEFGISFPKSVKRVRELYKEPDFHGDGEAAILFSVDKGDIKEIKDDLEEYKVQEDENILSQIDTCFMAVKKRGFDTDIDLNNEVYFKATSDNVFQNMYGNFIALIIDEEKGEILYLQWDT